MSIKTTRKKISSLRSDLESLDEQLILLDTKSLKNEIKKARDELIHLQKSIHMFKKKLSKNRIYCNHCNMSISIESMVVEKCFADYHDMIHNRIPKGNYNIYCGDCGESLENARYSEALLWTKYHIENHICSLEEPFVKKGDG